MAGLPDDGRERITGKKLLENKYHELSWITER